MRNVRTSIRNEIRNVTEANEWEREGNEEEVSQNINKKWQREMRSLAMKKWREEEEKKKKYLG